MGSLYLHILRGGGVGCGLAFVLLCAILVLLRLFTMLHTFLKDATEELGRVAWPTPVQAAQLTALTVVVAVAAAAFFAGLDAALATGYRFLLTLN